MNGVGRITENKWMRRLRSDLRIVLDLILRSDLRFGPAQNEHLVVRTDGHWPFRASGLLEPLARLAKEGEKTCRASGQCRGLHIKNLFDWSVHRRQNNHPKSLFPLVIAAQTDRRH